MLRLNDRTLVVHLAQFAPKSIQQMLELRSNLQMAIEHAKCDLAESEFALQSELGMETHWSVSDKEKAKRVRRVKRQANGDIDITPIVKKVIEESRNTSKVLR